MEKISLHLFSLALLCLHCLSACLALRTATRFVNLTQDQDQEALLALKYHIISDPSNILISNWSASSSSSVCQWKGVSCSPDHHRVIALNISNMNLTGTIPPQLGNLSFLVSLDLRNNGFHGELPRELANLRQLGNLELSNNNLGGSIPTWFHSLQHLKNLTLKNNAFTGGIPPSLANATKLEKVSFSYNRLEGTIPKELGHLQNLKLLALGYNQFSGPIPHEIFNITMLEVLELPANNLYGNLPDDICHQLQRLQKIVLSQNMLSGQMPSNFSGCSKLQVLVLSRNSLTGSIQKEIQKLEIVEQLYLDNNKLAGLIPKEIGNLTMLKKLVLGDNNFSGGIPRELGNLYSLELMSLQVNSFSGSIPAGIFNLSTMKNFSVARNHLFGSLPSNLCHGLPSLEAIYLDTNNFSGTIPVSISNCSQLTELDLSANKFTGPIPNSLGDLRHLHHVTLSKNLLTRESLSIELSFITSLTNNCKELRYLALDSNPLNGVLPKSIGNLSASLEEWYAYDCNIMGSIPDSVGNLSNIISLSLRENLLTGPMPSTIKRLQKLQSLDLGTNNLSGVFPDDLCVLKNLYGLYINQTQISGSLPECLGNISSLRHLSLNSNSLNSSIPAKFWNLKDLLYVDLSSNFLSGSLPPELGDLKAVVNMNFSTNYLSGEIPDTIGGLQNLKSFSLANNRLQGVIPETIGQMFSLEYLDLSNNTLSGSIPPSLVNVRYLSYFNVSHNRLSGEIPSEGPFRNFSSESFTCNEALCGIPRFGVTKCKGMSSHITWLKMKFITIFAAIVTLLILIVCVMAFGLRHQRSIKADEVPNGTNLSSVGRKHERITCDELEQATEGYSERNLLGTGSFGSVYRGNFSDGRILAIKVFNLEFEGAFKSFEMECQILSKLRHRNLVKVISTCSTADFMALVLEYMPNGNLEKWLYSHEYFLDIMQRINIIIDVGSAIHYLHSGYFTTIVHCDLKPSNVLLDQDMVAHVSDFGIAKMLSHEESFTNTKTLATLGYIAPEYGLEGLVSTRCDIYSYGILLMEVFTRKRPSDELFGEDLSLKDWVRFSQANLADIVDGNLLGAGTDYYTEKLECISSIMDVALNCTKESPKERISMRDVLARLNCVKLQLLHMGA